MNYIEKIRNNANNAIQIGKIAIAQKIEYDLAKIMYHDGKKDINIEDAKKILEILKNDKIPVNLMEDLEIINIYKSHNNICLTYVFEKITQYANRKYITDLDPYISARYCYGRKVYELITKGYSLDKAVKKVEDKIAYEIKKNKLSELAAVVKTIFFSTNIEALAFEHQYVNHKAVKYNASLTVKNGIVDCGKYKVKKIYGMTLLSQTDEGLKELEDTVEMAFEKGNSLFLSELSKEASFHNLFVADFSLEEMETQYSFYDSGYKYIYLKTNYKEKSAVSFLHETTHFLDNVRGDTYMFFSVNNPVIQDILKKIKANKWIIPRGVSLGHFIKLNMFKYVSNDILNQKWLSEIKSKNINASDKDIKHFMQQKRLYERKKYELLLGCIADIYDGLSRGYLHSNLGVPGHGKEYFFDEEHVCIEFIAQIGTLYNSGGVDIINYEFGEELAKEIVDMYEKFIKNDHLSNMDVEITENVSEEKGSRK